ncbi:MAG: ABC transporter ATP-binding protein [Alphaproteobacteria bacterium]|nr:ABC transporter ATP-binding protein [Alphaproteobacteria bacterium]
MSVIELKNLTKKWDDFVAVDDVTFTVDEGSFLVLLGPSGCGKSTTLRMIAGLDPVSSGTILIDGKDVTTTAPAKRQISMVFQSYALFPHLSVAENIIFGLKVRKVPADERDKRLGAVAEIVGLSGLLDRKPAQLSGGQRQRVALARATIAENNICLMDEPLSNLDAQLRHDMRIEIRSLQQRLGMTVIYVTHDQTEAMSMADKIILLRDGHIEQEGTPEDLYKRPATTFSAAFIGTPPMNLLTLANGADGAVIKGSSQGNIFQGPGEGLVLGLRPEHISITDGDGLAAELLAADYLGADTIMTASIGGQMLQIRMPGHFNIGRSNQARLTWPDEAVFIFDADTGKRIDHSAQSEELRKTTTI